MATFYTELNDTHREFITAQRIFFTATAPTSGRINLSPKGMDSFRCLDERRVAYLDLTGSGNETAAHLQENGRITIMFCAFEGEPAILRLHGTGSVVRTTNPEWSELKPLFPDIPGERQIMLIEIDSVQHSCGYAVPVMEFKEERARLREWSQKKGPEGIRKYQQKNNQTSIDGLPTGLFEE